MLRKLLLLTFIIFFGIGFFKYADAHVTLNPNESEPESYDKYDVRVPVEQNDHTVKVELDVPKGLNVESVKPVEGFKHHFLKDEKGNITKITWTATDKGIGPHEFIEFPIVVANPKKEGTFKWNATQTYDNGDVVRWTGKEDSEHPAPTTTVKKGANPNETHSDSSQGDSIALWIIAIVAIVISLIALFKQAHPKKFN
ncbi:YcnI family protein [Staphylococcus epidermidis]|uniref:YcnI family protein n=1 Tax=Staphylococcus epidermidis TaxID=1282 RepID=UPI001D0D0FBF|nr:YcnI family protein [Staphylococcus epidermidis]MCC2071549.1 YcnI family protein [Staphylococcus epidermidis]